MDSNLNFTAHIRIPLMRDTIFVWKNTLEVESEILRVWVFCRWRRVRPEASLWKDMKLGAEYVKC